MRAADQVIEHMASAAGTTSKEFTMGVLRDLPVVANGDGDPDVRRLMELASLCIVMNSPSRLPDRTIRNCSLMMRNEEVNVYIWYLD